MTMAPITLLLAATQVYAVPLSTRTDGAGPSSISAILRARASASNPNRNVECNAFDGSCPKGLVCDKSKHCVKAPCEGTCDVCLFKGRCIRVNQGQPVSEGMCEHYKGTWCSGPAAAPSPPPLSAPPTVPPAAQGPWDVLAYGFTVAPNEPNFIKTTTQLFSIGSNDVSVLTQTTADGKMDFSDSEHTAAARLRAQAGISGKHGPFSGAASMAIARNTGSSIKTARVDAYYQCKKQRVASKGGFRLSPGTRLIPAYRQYILSVAKDQVHKIAEQFGIFFAKSANLGGVVQKTYTMEMTKHDTQSSITAELRAKFGGWLLGGKASLSGSISSRSSRRSRGAKMETSFHVEGGNTGLWLGLSTIPTDPGAFHRLQQKWAASITDKNLYPFDVELRPIWELVSEVDKEKGGLLQRFLLQKWQAEASRFNPTKFFTCGPPFCWPEIYRFTGTVQYTHGHGHEHILGDFKKTTVTSNGAYVYESVNRKAFGASHNKYMYPVFLYLYRDPKTGELVWVFGATHHDKPEEVNDPRYSASKDWVDAHFDSSSSAKGACALNGPAAPACKWRECNGVCYAYPTITGTYGKHTWYGASASLKVVVGGKGGH